MKMVIMTFHWIITYDHDAKHQFLKCAINIFTSLTCLTCPTSHLYHQSHLVSAQSIWLPESVFRVPAPPPKP